MSKHHPIVLPAARQLTSRREPPWYADQEECQAYDRAVQALADRMAADPELDSAELERASIARNANR